MESSNVTEVEWIYFNCGNHTSQGVPWPWVCDNDPDCGDGSDESRDLCKNVGECGLTFTTPHGLLASPFYPDKYADDADCVNIITQPNDTIILLNFLSMNTDDCCDELEMRDGMSQDAPLIRKISGNVIPSPIQSSQNHLWMK